MLFGFVAAIVVGFLLTAVQTWTGIPGIRGAYLLGLVLLWLSARIGLLLGTGIPAWLLGVLDLLFLPVAAIVLAIPVLRIRQWRNSVFVPILLAMTAANGLFHASVYHGDAQMQAMAANFMVMLVTLLMTVVAGRVVPMFTANGTGTERVPPIQWLERACPLAILATFPVAMNPDLLPDGLAASLFLVAAACHGLRVLRWRIWVTLSTPLVWSLHLSYWAIAVGLFALDMSRLTDWPGHSQAIHVLTVGAMGMMILAMISRVSLGHTGRPLVVGWPMIAAYLAILAALLLRVTGGHWLPDYRLMVVGSAVLWALAYGLFVLRYLPILGRRCCYG